MKPNAGLERGSCQVYVSPSLSEDDQIAFNAGSHTEVMRLAYADFERLAKPKVVRMTD